MTTDTTREDVLAERIEEREPDSADRADLDRYASYEEDGDTVICDRRNPAAWIKADAVAPLER